MSFWRTYYHLVWSTSNREPFITAEIEPRLFAYLIKKSAELGVYVYAINGWVDHIHLIVSIPPKLSVAEVVKHLKGASSHDLNHSFGLNFTFAWQRGYGVLTLGERQRKDAEAYVHNQKSHHKEQTTNAWLERDTDLDEGPAETGIKPDRVPPVLREEHTFYTAFGDPPF